VQGGWSTGRVTRRLRVGSLWLRAGQGLRLRLPRARAGSRTVAGMAGVLCGRDAGVRWICGKTIGAMRLLFARHDAPSNTVVMKRWIVDILLSQSR
jgi:hypothetical protein